MGIRIYSICYFNNNNLDNNYRHTTNIIILDETTNKVSNTNPISSSFYPQVQHEPLR